MLIGKVEDFRFNGKSAIAAYLDGRQVWFKKYPVDASLLGGGVLSAPVRVVERVEKAVSLSGEGALSASAAVRVPDIQLSSEGTLSATATPAPLILATASGPTNASRDVTLTFPGYVPKANDVVALWPSCKVVTAAAVWPSGWLNPRGGAPPSVTGITEGCAVHIVTAAEESGGSNTFTMANYWNVAQTGDVVGLVARYVSNQVPYDMSVAAGTATPSTLHTFSSFNATNVRFANTLYVGSMASSALGIYTALPPGYTTLISSNINQGRVLIRRTLLSVPSMPVTGGNATFNSSTAWMGYSLLLTPDFPGTYRNVPFTGGGTLVSQALYPTLTGGGTLSATVKAQYQRSADLSGGGTLSATVDIKNIISTASAPTNASRTVTLTFPDYTDVKANDFIMLWPSTIAASSALTTPAGWTNVRGGNSTSTTTGVTMGYLYHFVTPAEESAGQNTFTLTNLWNVAQTGAVVGIVARYVSTQIPVDSNTVTPVGSPVTNHQLGAFAALATRFSNSLIIGSVAAGAPTTYGPPSTGWTKLLESNTNAGRYLARRNALTTAGVSSNINICTAGTATVYTGVDLLLVQNFDGTLVQPALSGGGTLSATAAEKLWTPADIPGLAAWIDPQQDLALGRFTDGQRINSYTSYDPGGRVFTAPNAPAFLASSVGGKPRIKFDVARTDFMYTDGYNPGTTGMTYVMVTQADVPANYGMMITWGQPATGMEMRQESFSFKLQCIANYSGGGPVASSAFTGAASTDYVNLLKLDRPANKFRLYINDTLQFDLGTVALPDVADRLRIGHRDDGYYYNGLIAEALVISGPISDADRAKLMTYLRAKHSQSFPAAT